MFSEELNTYPKAKRKIAESFFDLLEKKSFDEITVKEICEQTSYSRRTFYRYYKSKSDIVKDHAAFFMMSYMQGINLSSNLYSADFCQQYFEFWHTQESLCKLLMKQELYKQIILQVNEVLTKVIHKNLQDQYNEENIKNLEDLSVFILSGITGVLIKWLEDGCVETPEELAKAYESMSSTYFDIIAQSDKPSELKNAEEVIEISQNTISAGRT